VLSGSKLVPGFRPVDLRSESREAGGRWGLVSETAGKTGKTGPWIGGGNAGKEKPPSCAEPQGRLSPVLPWSPPPPLLGGVPAHAASGDMIYTALGLPRECVWDRGVGCVEGGLDWD
jgi:hypothetical protein